MTTACIIQFCAGHLKFYTTLQQVDGINKCLEDFRANPGIDGLVINAFTNKLHADGTDNLKGADIIFGHSNISA